MALGCMIGAAATEAVAVDAGRGIFENTRPAHKLTQIEYTDENRKIFKIFKG